MSLATAFPVVRQHYVLSHFDCTTHFSWKICLWLFCGYSTVFLPWLWKVFSFMFVSILLSIICFVNGRIFIICCLENCLHWWFYVAYPKGMQYTVTWVSRPRFVCLFVFLLVSLSPSVRLRFCLYFMCMSCMWHIIIILSSPVAELYIYVWVHCQESRQLLIT
jgi:hypothetical protein